MARIKFVSRWFLRYQQMLSGVLDLVNAPWAFLLLAYDKKKYRKPLGTFLMHLDEWERTHNDTREIEVDLKISYRDRTLDQNALMWALYEIEAEDQNGGMVGAPHQMVSKDYLYDNDLENWGEKDLVRTVISRLHFYLTNYRIVRIRHNEAFIRITKENRSEFMSLSPETEVTLQITRGTSQYNTVEMARHIDGQFNRLAETLGISDTGDLALYKEQFETFKKKKGIEPGIPGYTRENDFRLLEMEE